MLLALRSLWDKATDTASNAFGLARLFYWQRQQSLALSNKKRREEEELIALLALEF